MPEISQVKNRNNFLMEIGKIIKDKELFYSSILLVLIFSIFAPMFFTWDNVSNVLRTVSVSGVMALGLIFVMMPGDFDLSFATASSLLVIITMIMLNAGIPMFLAFTVVILLGIIWELFNAALIVGIKMHAFIATIASWTIARGFIYWITNGQTYYGNFPDSLQIIGRNNVLKWIPICSIIFVVCAVIACLLANRTKFGRYLYAIGDNLNAAKYAGIKSDKLRVTAFILNGICLGIASIILGSKLCSAPVAAGDGFQMTVIGAAFLGATVFKPGVVNMGGSILSIFLLTIVENGLIMLNVPFYFKYLFQGIIIICAIAFISLKNRKNGLAGKGPAIY